MQTHVFRVAKRTQEKRRIGVQAACSACRRRKLSCDGQRPRCARCQKRGELECVYDTQRADETRTQAIKRELDDVKLKLDYISQTLTTLKELPSDGAARLMGDVLKDSDPTASLVALGMKIQLQSVNLGRQISMLNSMRATFPNTKSNVQFELYLYFPKWYPALKAEEVPPAVIDNSPRNLYELQTARGWHLSSSSLLAPTTFTNIPGSAQQDWLQITFWNLRVPGFCIRHWTKVPISIGLAEKALNAFLHTDHVLFAFMDTELFLNDFSSCKNRYCSRALVNAMLHYGCTKIAHSDLEAGYVVSQLRMETENALRNDHDPGITKIAALNIHYTVVIFCGPFEKGDVFLDQAITLCDKLYGWQKPSPQYTAWCQSSEDERAVAHVMWSVCSSAVFRAHRRGGKIPPPIPRLEIPYLDPSTRTRIDLQSSPAVDMDSIVCHRYLSAAISANIPFVRESVMLHLSKVPLSDEERASTAASIYRRALDNIASNPRPQLLHAELADILSLSQMWSHFWILSVFQPLTHYKGAIPGFQASAGTAGAIFVASAKQLQHWVFFYQQYYSLAPPTIACHGPIFVAAVALTQTRKVADRALKFEALLRLFADLAISFPGLRNLMQSLAITGYEAGLVDLPKIRKLFDQFSDVCAVDRKVKFTTANRVEGRKMAAELRERSYDIHFEKTHVLDELEDEGEDVAPPPSH